MELQKIFPKRFKLKSIDIWERQWFVLTCGDFKTGKFNSMTIAWGSVGVMWSKPFVQVVVRPTRHTYTFMNKYDTFTVCAFPKQHKRALSILGTVSGKNRDKIKETGLTPIASSQVAAPAFAEAELIIECKKNYWDDLNPENVLLSEIDRHYPNKDYHRIYFGEILAINGTDKFID